MNTKMVRDVEKRKNLEIKMHASYYGCINLVLHKDSELSLLEKQLNVLLL